MSKDTGKRSADSTEKKVPGEVYPEQIAAEAARRAAAERKRSITVGISLICTAAVVILGAVFLMKNNSEEQVGTDSSSSAVSRAETVSTEESSAPDSFSAAESEAPPTSEADSSSEEDGYVPDRDNIYSSDFYTYGDGFKEVTEYDFESLLGNYPEACTAIAISRGTGERINIRSIEVGDTINMYATTNIEGALAQAVRDGGVSLPKYEKGFLDKEYWDSVEFNALYDPLNTEPLTADFTGRMMLDKEKGIELKLVKEFAPKGTASYMLDHVGSLTYDMTRQFKKLGEHGSIFAKYAPEVYSNAKGISFIVSPVTLSYMDSSTDVTDIKNAGFIACCFTSDGCVVISAENKNIFEMDEFPESVDMITRKRFNKILDTIKADMLG